MNKKLTLALTLAFAASIAMQAQDDDLYFTPSKKKSTPAVVTSSQRYQPIDTEAARPSVEVYNNSSRTDDDYNRRYSNYAGSWQTGGGATTDTLTTDSLLSEVVPIENGYDVNDPENDFTYSRRILRFHSPRFGYALSSPFYWDLVYGYGIYDYLYDPFFYDPFYWDYGWGYGWSWGPWNSWYGPLWGWSHPYHWDYWGYGPTWHHSHIIISPNYASRSWNRGSFTQNRFGNGGSAIRTSALASNGATRSGNGVTLARTSARTNISQQLQDRTAPQSRTSANRTAYDRQSSTRTTVNNRTTVDARNASRTQSQVQTQTQQVQTQTQQRTQQVQTPTRTQQNVSTPTRTQSQSYTPTTTTRSSSSSFSSGASRSSGSSFGGGGSFSGGGGSRSSGGRR